MKPVTRDPLWWAACLAAVAAGVWFGLPRDTTTSLVVNDEPEKRTGSSVPAHDSGNGVGRALDRFEVDSLFESLLEPSGLNGEVVKSIVDREGWKAWPKVLGIADPELREKLSAAFLEAYALRDPFQAFAEWKKHRSTFAPESWGIDAVMTITGAASRKSAESLVEVLEGSRTDSPNSGTSTDFADDFDFVRVMDYLASSDGSTLVEVLNLMPTWAERSPLQAAKWIEAHQDFVLNNGNLNLSSAMREVMGADLSPSDREEAIRALGTLPQASVEQIWGDAIRSSAGIPEANLLESATLMNRREGYLRAVLLEARRQGKLDQSWNMIPTEERAAIAEAADAAWNPGSSPVEMESKERWRGMIADAWGVGR